MDTIPDLIKNLAALPMDRLAILVALAALALATFTVYAVVSLAKESRGER